MNVAIYVRLSEEDRDKTDKEANSESIVNQKSMLSDYAESRGWNIISVYSDDDYSGSDSSRPGFNAMIRDASERKFSILLCKSLSRFARDVAMVETYINGYFLEWGIRFISITDYADTSLKGNRKNIQINSLVNQWYLEDLSENIKSVMTHKKKQGQYVGSFAPYGYIKDENDSHKLVVDEDAALVVKKIFSMYLDNYGTKAIANHLNSLGIACPSKYRIEKRLPKNRDIEKAKQYLWSDHSVGLIIQNPNYTGDLVQCRYKRPTYKSKASKATSENEWIVVADVHEPIVTKEDYQKAQKVRTDKLRKRKPDNIYEPNVFAGFIKCKICSRSLVLSNSGKLNNNTRYLRCIGRKSGISGCDCAMVKYEVLVKLVTEEIGRVIAEYCDFETLEKRTQRRANEFDSEVTLLERNKDRLEAEQKRLDVSLGSIYIDKSTGVISEEEFRIISAQLKDKRVLINEEITQIYSRLDEIRSVRVNLAKTKGIVEKYKDFTQLTRNMVEEFVSVIYIGKRDVSNLKDIDIEVVMNV